MPNAEPFPLLYRDDLLVAVSKPSGIAVHRGWSRERIVVLTVLRDQLGRRLFPVHRLDRGTSGVLLFALDPATARGLQEQLAAGRMSKRYLALVRGITADEGLIDHPVPRSPGGPRVPAVTAYRRLATFERYSLLEVVPQTGRLHQIRRHLAHLSHPLVGDVNYGRGDINRKYRAEYALHRLALHAWKLAFDDPWSGTRLTIQVDLPPDLSAPFASLGLAVP